MNTVYTCFHSNVRNPLLKFLNAYDFFRGRQINFGRLFGSRLERDLLAVVMYRVKETFGGGMSLTFFLLHPSVYFVCYRFHSHVHCCLFTMRNLNQYLNDRARGNHIDPKSKQV